MTGVGVYDMGRGGLVLVPHNMADCHLTETDVHWFSEGDTIWRTGFRDQFQKIFVSTERWGLAVVVRGTWTADDPVA